jgi:hypothetical protein
LLPVSIGWVVNPSDDDDQKVMKAPAVSLDAPRRLPPPLCHIGQITCALGLNGRLVYISLASKRSFFWSPYGLDIFGAERRWREDNPFGKKEGQ